MVAVDRAFVAMPRTGFLRPAERDRAHHDAPLPIGHGVTNSQPRTVVDMLRLLDVQPGMSVLDVGSGSGWTTALLAHLVGPTGRVLGVEIIPELAAWGAQNLAATWQPWASIRQAIRGVLGAPDDAPFDRILVSAEAAVLPRELIAQLADPGVLVMPVADQMRKLVRDAGRLHLTEHGWYRFVPLR